MDRHPPAAIAVLGLGNVIHSDDGVGVHAVQSLRADTRVPGDVEFIEGGTLGLDLLPHVWDASRLLVLDAVDVGAAPGTLVCLSGEELWQLRRAGDAHLAGLADLLSALRLVAAKPPVVTVLGVQPRSTAWGTELSAEVGASLPQLVTAALDVLRKWTETTEKVTG